MKNHRKLLSFMLMLVMLLLNAGCAGDKIDESTKYEVDGVIFENDLISITGVSTDEYVEVFKTQTILYTYFSTDYEELGAANILELGGATILVIPGENYLEELPSSVLAVFEDDAETIVTDKLEEFFICEDADGSRAIYYETYHVYDDQGKKKYVTLKAYKIEFEHYLSASEPKIEAI